MRLKALILVLVFLPSIALAESPELISAAKKEGTDFGERRAGVFPGQILYQRAPVIRLRKRAAKFMGVEIAIWTLFYAPGQMDIETNGRLLELYRSRRRTLGRGSRVDQLTPLEAFALAGAGPCPGGLHGLFRRRKVPLRFCRSLPDETGDRNRTRLTRKAGTQSILPTFLRR